MHKYCICKVVGIGSFKKKEIQPGIQIADIENRVHTANKIFKFLSVFTFRE
jgi:hypothetical protein